MPHAPTLPGGGSFSATQCNSPRSSLPTTPRELLGSGDFVSLHDIGIIVGLEIQCDSKEEVPMKTMRGHQGVPIDAPAPPPSAPPATSENVQAPRFEPPRSAPPPLTHTNSAPLVPQLKNLGPSPLGPGQIQSQGWHDPGAATAGNNRVGDGLSMPSGGVGNATSPVIQQSLSGFNSTSASSASLSSAAFASMPTQSLPASPRALPTHSRTRSRANRDASHHPLSTQHCPRLSRSRPVGRRRLQRARDL